MTNENNEQENSGLHESTESGDGAMNAGGSVEDEVSQLKVQLQEAKEALLYQAAELENFKKRVQREKDEFFRFANEGIIRDLLDAMDGIHIAISSMPENAQTKSYLDGIKMIEQMLVKALEKHGVEKIKAEGRFDMNFHDAVKKVKKEGIESKTIIQAERDGYLLHGRLLRPARVIVAE